MDFGKGNRRHVKLHAECRQPTVSVPFALLHHQKSSTLAIKAKMVKPIPIEAGKEIATKYGYDQVVIVARKVGEGGGEHVTTYGVNKANCAIAARIGDFFKHKLMGWPP